MNIKQIEYFLEIAKCKNISDAAEHLYVTQPTLGRQMTALEAELNMQLFFRSNKGMRLTPAGVVMYQEFQQMMELFQNAVKKGQMASHGYDGRLKLGILSGLDVGDILRKLVVHMGKHYPSVQLDMAYLSNGEMAQMISHGELDLAISVDLAFWDLQNVNKINLTVYEPAFFVPAAHPLAQRERVFYRDLVEEELVIVKKGDCPIGEELIVEECKRYGGFYPKFFYVDTMENAILWVQSGLKIAILNTKMALTASSEVKTYPMTEVDHHENYIQAVSSRNNQNIALNFAWDFLQQL